MEIPKPLIKELADSQATLFLGSGAGVHVGLPNGEGLADRLVDAADLADQIPRPRDLAIVAQQLYSTPGYDVAWVRDALDQILNDRGVLLKSSQDPSFQMLSQLTWRAAFTTNFDRTLEVAYEHSVEQRQRLLPYYTPDEQVLRYDSSILRYIKLNGSIDEAKRNATHELVLTFGEQQDARSRNAIFYQLLKECSINGPIVFIGFSFTHPGAIQPATSPEYMLFRELLQTMGKAARQHYCVFPYDEGKQGVSAFLQLLRGAKIMPLNGTLEEFAQTASIAVSKPSIVSLETTEIEIRVGKAGVSVTQARQLQLSRNFEIVRQDAPDSSQTPGVESSLNGHSNWNSFFEGHFVSRPVFKDVLNAFRHSVQDTELTVMTAPLGWGKSFVVKAAAATAAQEDVPVLWLNPIATTELARRSGSSYTAGTWDFKAIAEFVRELNNASALISADDCPTIVADNCPERHGEVVGLVKYLREAGVRAHVIFVARDTEFDQAIELSSGLKLGKHLDLTMHDSEVEDLDRLLEFCEKHRIGGITSPTERELVRSVITKERAAGHLLLALVIIFDNSHRPFSEIIGSLWDQLSTMERDVVLRVSLMHQHGTNVMPRFVSIMRTFPDHEGEACITAYNTLLVRNVLFATSVYDEDVVGVLHPIVAAEFVKASGLDTASQSERLQAVVSNMSTHPYDMELLKRLVKGINDYEVSVGNRLDTAAIFEEAAKATNDDAIICQQYAKFLLHNGDFKAALAWIERGILSDPAYAPLTHSKGNILRRWGMSLLDEGDRSEADRLFNQARRCFEDSRLKREADEYGFVTHLDMLSGLITRVTDPLEQAQLVAEGIGIYREGIAAVPKDRFNILLDPRYKQFDPHSKTLDRLSAQLLSADPQTLSTEARGFLARVLVSRGQFDEALALVKQRENTYFDARLSVVEAEILVKGGQIGEALQPLEDARRSGVYQSDREVRWKCDYWSLIARFIRQEYALTHEAARRLSENRDKPRDRIPRGYLWKKSAASIPDRKRKLATDALLLNGRFRQQSSDEYGRLYFENILGEQFWIRFNPQFFDRADFRSGESVAVAISILPGALRAENPNRPPFNDLPDDVFVAEDKSKGLPLDQRLQT